jgi:colanic acid/amylovoran biosynthesis protein
MASDAKAHNPPNPKINENERIRVCLMGAPFDTNNRGVSALASSLVRLVVEATPGARISIFMGNPSSYTKEVNFAGKEVSVNVINCRLSPRAKLQEHIFFLLFLTILTRLMPSSRLRRRIVHWSSRLEDLYACDFIGAINGGDSFSDIYGLSRFVGGMIPLIMIILLGKNLTLLPQTYGPYNSRLARSIARWVIKRSSPVLSRDMDGISLVRDLLKDDADKVPVAFCPDVAFTLPSLSPNKVTVNPSADIFGEGTWVGINVNGLMFHGGYIGGNMFGLRFEYKAFILRLIEKFIRETDAKIILIPHTYGEKGNVNSDPEASRQVFEDMKDHCGNRLFMLTGEYKEAEIKWIIGRCNFFIGSRMHACIAAISQGIPTAAVAYSKKFRGVFESVGLGSMVIDARSLDLNDACNMIVGIFHNRKTGKAMMKGKIDHAKDQVRETFIQLLSVQGLGGEAR